MTSDDEICFMVPLRDFQELQAKCHDLEEKLAHKEKQYLELLEVNANLSKKSLVYEKTFLGNPENFSKPTGVDRDDVSNYLKAKYKWKNSC